MLSLEPVREAFRLLWAHKLRAVLTMFGVVWGTAAVIFLVGWGDGVNRTLEQGFYRAGRNMGEVWAGRVSEDFTPAVDRRYLWYSLEDLEVLRRRARLPEIVGGESWEMLPAAFGQSALTVDVRGIEPEVMQIRGIGLTAGRGITRSDVDHRRRVVVLGDTVRRNLLGARGQLGSRIRIGGIPFEVVGMLEPVGFQLSRDRMLIDEQVWIPISTLQANWPSWWTDQLVVNKIIYRMRDLALLEPTEREVRAILAERLGVASDDTEAVGIHSAVKVLRQIPIGESKGLMFVLAATTLAIGGIGVLSMMLDSVHERRQEIGVRMAVGARRRDIVGQFFVETLTITLLGGVIGVAFGIGGCWLLENLSLPDLVPVPILSERVVLLALAVMISVGLAAGVIPAWRAARIDPSITLRMD